jgi:hypothetical protein
MPTQILWQDSAKALMSEIITPVYLTHGSQAPSALHLEKVDGTG